MKEITSIQNSYIKNLLKIQEKSRERKKQSLFLVEGKREISLAIAANYEFEDVLFLESFISEEEILHLFNKNINRTVISKEVYQKLAYRDSTEGIIAVAKVKSFSLSEIKFTTSTPLVLVAEATEKPGNIGAMLRTADAAGIDAVIIANPTTEIYNPNIIRSSLGSIFTSQIGIGSNEEVISFLIKENIQFDVSLGKGFNNKMDYFALGVSWNYDLNK